ncbi:spore cortex biosynthesis protein YabQ [Bacillaceae bacterium]
MSLEVEGLTILAMMACGVAAGIAFDSCRVLKHKSRLKGFSVIVYDLLFWIVCTLAIFFTLVAVNGGVVRIYIFFALLFGTWTYYSFLSGHYLRAFAGFVRLLSWCFRTLLRMLRLLLVEPFVLLYKLFVLILTSLFSLLYGILSFIGKLLFSTLFPLRAVYRKMKTPLARKKQGIFRRLANLFKRNKK